MNNNNLKLKKIKIDNEDKIKGFHILINNGSSVICLPRNEYIVSEDALEDLQKEGVKFNESENGNKIKCAISGTPKI